MGDILTLNIKILPLKLLKIEKELTLLKNVKDILLYSENK